jgi:hypothetical protein
MAGMDREVVIHPCKMFQPRIEAIVEASGDLIAYKLFLKF